MNRDLRTQKFRNIKITPLSQLKFDSLAKEKLRRWAVREEQDVAIDYRTPFYAVKNDDSSRIEKSSRISGVKGLKPVNRAKIVEKCYDQVVKTAVSKKEYIE